MKKRRISIASFVRTKMIQNKNTTEENTETNSFPIEKSYLHYNIKLLSILGMWNPYNDKKKYWLHNFYEFIVLSTVFLMRMVGLLHGVWLARNDLVGIVRPLSDLLSFAMIFLKYFNLLFRKSDVIKVMNAFNWERRILCSRRIARNRNKILTYMVRYSKLSSQVVVGGSMIYTASFFLLTVDLRHLTIDDLPLSSTPFRIIFEPLNIWVAVIFDYITWTLFVCTFFSLDILFLNLMMNISTQLDILNFRLGTLLRKNSDDKSIELRANSREINFQYFECTKNEEFSPNQELIISIQHYNQIYWMVKLLKGVLGLVLLPQLVISLLFLSILGFCSFVGTTNDELDVGTTIFNAIDFSAAFVQILIFCWAGHGIILSSDRVCSAAYEAHWYNGDKKFKKNLLILQSLVVNPLAISAVGLFDLSAITFKNMLIKSYSTIALLRQMYE